MASGADGRHLQSHGQQVPPLLVVSAAHVMGCPRSCFVSVSVFVL